MPPRRSCSAGERVRLDLLVAAEWTAAGGAIPAQQAPMLHCSECCYSACMVSITVRDVPLGARDELAARAARSGRSLQEYLRQQLIDLASRPDPDALARRIAERKQRTSTTLSAATIIEHRDADRR